MPENEVTPPGTTSRAFDAAGWLWVGLIALASVALSRAFACATPFAALATLAAFTMRGRQAVALVLVVWIANQAIGFALLHYPWTASTLAWGIAIGMAAAASLAAASSVSRWTDLTRWAAVPLGLIAAFFAYELVLYSATWILASGTGAFAASVVMRLFAIDAVALGLLVGVQRLATGRGGAMRPANAERT